MYTTNPHERSASNGQASCLPSDHRAPTKRPPSELARQLLGGRSASDHRETAERGRLVAARWAISGVCL